MMQQQKWESHHRLQPEETRKFLHHRVYLKDAQYARGALRGNAIFVQKDGLPTTFCNIENLLMPALGK